MTKKVGRVRAAGQARLAVDQASTGATPESETYRLRLGYVLWAVRMTDREIIRCLGRVFRGTGVTKSQFGAMQVLNEMESASSATLARTLFVSPQAVVGLVQSMEQSGYIVRKSKTTTTARIIEASLTKEGRKVFHAAAKRFEEIDALVDKEFTAEEQDTLLALLARLRDILKLA